MGFRYGHGWPYHVVPPSRVTNSMTSTPAARSVGGPPASQETEAGQVIANALPLVITNRMRTVNVALGTLLKAMVVTWVFVPVKARASEQSTVVVAPQVNVDCEIRGLEISVSRVSKSVLSF